MSSNNAGRRAVIRKRGRKQICFMFICLQSTVRFTLSERAAQSAHSHKDYQRAKCPLKAIARERSSNRRLRRYYQLRNFIDLSYTLVNRLISLQQDASVEHGPLSNVAENHPDGKKILVGEIIKMYKSSINNRISRGRKGSMEKDFSNFSIATFFFVCARISSMVLKRECLRYN